MLLYPLVVLTRRFDSAKIPVVRQTAGVAHEDANFAKQMRLLSLITWEGGTRDGLIKGDEYLNLTAASKRLKDKGRRMRAPHSSEKHTRDCHLSSLSSLGSLNMRS